MGKRPLDGPKLRWENCVTKEVKKIEPELSWKDAAEDRGRWQDLCLIVWS